MDITSKDSEECITFEEIINGYQMVIEAQNKLDSAARTTKPYTIPELYSNVQPTVETNNTDARIMFDQLIIGYNFMIDLNRKSLDMPDHYIDKVRTENTKWIRILQCFNINSNNLKCKSTYKFTKRNASFVLYLLSQYVTNREFKKLRKYYNLSDTSELYKEAVNGFKEIMIDAGKSDNNINQQLRAMKLVTVTLSIKPYLGNLKQKIKSDFNSYIDNFFVGNFNLNMMDQLIIYKKMWHEYKRFLRRWDRKWREILNEMADIRSIEYDGTSHVDNGLFWSIMNEKSKILQNDSKYQMLLTELNEMDKLDNKDSEKIEELYRMVEVIEKETTEQICQKYNVKSSDLKPEHVLNMRDSYTLYKDAVKSIADRRRALNKYYKQKNDNT